MKKLSVMLIGLLVSSVIYPVYADNATLPKLKMKIINTIKNQHFALCIAENCYSIANPAPEINLEAGNIDSIVMTNMDNMQMYNQTLPPSCKITLKENQILTVSGKVVAKDAGVYLNDLSCSIVDNV